MVFTDLNAESREPRTTEREREFRLEEIRTKGLYLCRSNRVPDSLVEEVTHRRLVVGQYQLDRYAWNLLGVHY